METKYILVEWPESQYFIGLKGCYFISLNEDDDLSLDQAIFVPENVYDHYINGNINTI
jgi:hypothetical protein